MMLRTKCAELVIRMRIFSRLNMTTCRLNRLLLHSVGLHGSSCVLVQSSLLIFSLSNDDSYLSDLIRLIVGSPRHHCEVVYDAMLAVVIVVAGRAIIARQKLRRLPGLVGSP